MVLAVAAAALSNATARRERRLAWFGKPPGISSKAEASRAAARPSPGSARPAAPSPTSPAGASSGEPGIVPHPDRPWIEITPGQAKSLFDRGAIFIDARRSAAYREGHVRGARSIPVWESDADERVKAFVAEGHEANAPIVVYCSGGDCEDSHELAQKLWGVTFDNVAVYKDGFPDWERRGWPIGRGSAP